MATKINNSLTTLQNFKVVRPSTSSVLNPPAQLSKVCGGRLSQFIVMIQTEVIDSNVHNLSTHERALIELQLLYGLRVSEVLSINSSSIDSSLFIVVQGLKGSSDRIVTSISFRDYWRRVYQLSVDITQLANRFYYYRLLRRIGVHDYAQFGVNDRITHLFRYSVVYRMLLNNEPVGNIQQFLGHKSIDSTLYYINQLSNE